MDLSEKQVGEVSVLKLAGNFDINSYQPAGQWLVTATSHAPAYIVVDLADVPFIDSTGLSILIRGMKRSREQGGDLRLCSLQAQVRLVFELTRLDLVFEIFNSQDEAVETYAQPSSGPVG